MILFCFNAIHLTKMQTGFEMQPSECERTGYYQYHLHIYKCTYVWTLETLVPNSFWPIGYSGVCFSGPVAAKEQQNMRFSWVWMSWIVTLCLTSIFSLNGELTTTEGPKRNGNRNWLKATIKFTAFNFTSFDRTFIIIISHKHINKLMIAIPLCDQASERAHASYSTIHQFNPDFSLL